jgi:D-glycero-D-manno-heptose 1,7-bisphosphate phosphatase
MHKNQAVFLDRDGVLNRVILRDGKPFPPSNVEETEILPGVSEALIDLKKAGFLLIVVSNQPDVARGTTTKATVESINAYLADQLVVDDFKMCYHDSGDGCACRKPRPGMLLDAAKKYDIDLLKSYMIGDRWRDVEAGIAANCRTVFIDYSYNEERPKCFDFCTDSLLKAANYILEREQRYEKD